MALPLRPALESYARKSLLSDSEDAVQEALLTGSQRLGEFDAATGTSEFARWLIGLLRDRLSFYRRRRDREEERARDLWWHHVEQQEQAVRNAAIRSDLRLRARLAELSQREAECFAARLDGCTEAQIAAYLGVSRNAVHSYWRSAVRKLRAVPVEALEGPDKDFWELRIHDRISIYHARTKLGTQLANERLRKLK